MISFLLLPRLYFKLGCNPWLHGPGANSLPGTPYQDIGRVGKPPTVGLNSSITGRVPVIKFRGCGLKSCQVLFELFCDIFPCCCWFVVVVIFPTAMRLLLSDISLILYSLPPSLPPAYFSAMPLPSSGIIPVLQTFCPSYERDPFGFPNHPNSG